MATNRSSKAAKQGESKDTDKGLLGIAEIKMLIYVVPIALILAVFVYFISR